MINVGLTVVKSGVNPSGVKWFRTEVENWWNSIFDFEKIS